MHSGNRSCLYEKRDCNLEEVQCRTMYFVVSCLATVQAAGPSVDLQCVPQTTAPTPTGRPEGHAQHFEVSKKAFG